MNTLASRETSSAIEVKPTLLPHTLSVREDRVPYDPSSFHVTFDASKCYHQNDMSVTEGANISDIQVTHGREHPFRSPSLNTHRNKDHQDC